MKYAALVLSLISFVGMGQSFAQISSGPRIEHLSSTDAGRQRLRIARDALELHGRARHEVSYSGGVRNSTLRTTELRAGRSWGTSDANESPSIGFARDLVFDATLMPLDEVGRVGTSVRWSGKAIEGDINEADFLEFVLKSSIRASVIIDLLSPTAVGNATLSSSYAEQYKVPSSGGLLTRQSFRAQSSPVSAEIFAIEAEMQKEFDRDEVLRLERYEEYQNTAKLERNRNVRNGSMVANR